MSFLKMVRIFYEEDKLNFLNVFISSILGGISFLFLSFIIRNIISTNTFKTDIIFYFGVVLYSAWARNNLALKISARGSYFLQKKLIKEFLEAETENIEKTEPSYIQAYICQKIGVIESCFQSVFWFFIRDIATILVALFFIFYNSIVLSTVLIASTFLIWGATKFFPKAKNPEPVLSQITEGVIFDSTSLASIASKKWVENIWLKKTENFMQKKLSYIGSIGKRSFFLFSAGIFLFFILLFVGKVLVSSELIEKRNFGNFMISFLFLCLTVASLGINFVGIKQVNAIFADMPRYKKISILKDVKEPKLRINDLFFSYEKNEIFNGLSRKLENFCIIKGRSGIGKTTLLKILAGLIKPQRGDISYNSFAPEFINNLAFMPQVSSIYPGSIMENITLNRDLDKAYFDFVFEFCGLEKLLKKNDQDIKSHALSEGEKQRICLARSIISKPAILILDEPTSSLEKDLKKKILPKIKNIAELVILSTHDDVFEDLPDDQVWEI